MRYLIYLTTENFKLHYVIYILKRGSPQGVDPQSVGHTPPREEARLRTDADGCKEAYKLSAVTL